MVHVIPLFRLCMKKVTPAADAAVLIIRPLWVV